MDSFDRVWWITWFAALVTVLVAFFVAPAHAVQTKIITSDLGGVVAGYIERYKADARRGTLFEIHRYCASACTTILGLIPRERVCVTPEAAMGFHSGYFWTPFWKFHSQGTTNLMWQYYDEGVRNDLAQYFNWYGTTRHLDMMWLRAGRYFRICGAPVGGPTGTTKD